MRFADPVINKRYGGDVNGIYDTIINCLFPTDWIRCVPVAGDEYVGNGGGLNAWLLRSKFKLL